MKYARVLIAPTCAALSLVTALPAFAGPRSAAHDTQLTACSRYSNGCYTAALRPARDGQKLVLHHGTRIGCEGDCKNTLREATVDFWDTMRENGS